MIDGYRKCWVWDGFKVELGGFQVELDGFQVELEGLSPINIAG